MAQYGTSKKLTCMPTGTTVVKRVFKLSHSLATGWPQNTREAKELNMMPAPYNQQIAGKLYSMACIANTASLLLLFGE